MRTRIGTRLVLGAGLATAAVIGGMAFAVLRSHTAQLLAERTRSADQLSETIKSATHFDMLENRRENLHRQIRAVGDLRGEGIRKVRVFNKEGRIMFSSAEEEIGTSLDIRGEACYACHAEGRPLERLGIQARARTFRAPDGTRVLGLINPIPNEPSCSTAACHAHSAKQSLLGVLDVNVSLAEVDRQISRSRMLMGLSATVAILAGGLILWLLNRSLVVKPVAALVAGTRRVGEGDLGTTIPVSGNHELGELAGAFNTMSQRLAETQRQLAQADKLASVGRLAAGVAHEINNPLTGVLSYASLLRKRLDGDKESCDDLDVIVRETVRCRGIIRGLLDFARPTPPARKPMDLNEVVRRAVSVVMTQLSLNQVDLSLDLAPQLPVVHADANQIQQVAVNLLLNAGDAINGDGGIIKLTTRASSEGSVEMLVQDNGRGIPPEDLPRIFEPFYTTKGSHGTGLGLAVSWGIVEAHGGTLEVHSDPGQGTCFTLRIPASAGSGEGTGQLLIPTTT
ncbi:sensor histidine kinase [Geothrix alkalitolerans]|uniref:sensor histidine kinase n=1 Tax=Geothrix alkalitolerans TaxID=2922724 RepID=UPI001FAE827B|nr:ATP-binding protein [Geothrix alkalitolerans]